MIAVIAAMGKEVANLKEHGQNVKEGNIFGMDYFTADFFSQPTVVIKSGVGKVAAAAAAMLAVAVFKADAVINTGIAAAMNYQPCTVMLADKLVQHDFDMRADGKRLGQIQGFESEFFNSDVSLTEQMKISLEKSGVIAQTCTIASGDVFIADKRKMKQIMADFGAEGVDMESGAVAQVCTLAKVPFAVLRCVSDNGDNVEEYYDFAKKACENFTVALMKFFEYRAR